MPPLVGGNFFDHLPPTFWEIVNISKVATKILGNSGTRKILPPKIAMPPPPGGEGTATKLVAGATKLGGRFGHLVAVPSPSGGAFRNFG